MTRISRTPLPLDYRNHTARTDAQSNRRRRSL